MMQWSPSLIQGSPKTVPWGKASRVACPIAPNRNGPGVCAVTAPARCIQRQPAWTTRAASRRRTAVRDENVFWFFATGSP